MYDFSKLERGTVVRDQQGDEYEFIAYVPGAVEDNQLVLRRLDSKRLVMRTKFGCALPSGRTHDLDLLPPTKTIRMRVARTLQIPHAPILGFPEHKWAEIERSPNHEWISEPFDVEVAW